MKSTENGRKSLTLKAGIQERDTETSKRSRLVQNDVPAHTLAEALRVPEAIVTQYARKPTPPLRVAGALGIQPLSSRFRMLTSASIAYGLTKGGAQAPLIELEALSIRILRPLHEGDDLVARREALLKPRIYGEFLRRYNHSPLPKREIAINILTDMGIPEERAGEVFDQILESARSVQFISTIKDKEYVDLDLEGDGGGDVQTSSCATPDRDSPSKSTTLERDNGPESPMSRLAPSVLAVTPETSGRDALAKKAPSQTRVYISHGKNRTLLDPIKKLISFGKLEPVVSVERQSVSKPLPDKVMDEMRSCGAAIIHVDAETVLTDKDGHESVHLNPNVLIEIGAAIALYGRRIVLLVEKGVTLPSNLDGLFHVDYEGKSLDSDATIRVLEALSDLQNQPVPDRYHAIG